MDGTWSTVLICVALAVICVFAVRSYVKKLRNGCCGAGGDEVKKVRPADRDVSHYSYTRKVFIEGMTCKNCAMRIANAFNEREGYYAEVNLRQKYAVVRTKQSVSEDALKQIVQSAGYDALKVEFVE